MSRTSIGYAVVALAIVGLAPASTAQIPGFGKIELPSFGKKEDDTGKKVAAGATGCVLGGAAGAVVGGELGKMMGKQQGLFGDAAKALGNQMKLGGAAVGCAAGAGIGINIIESLSESARKSREDAWLAAQAQTGTVATWTDPNDPTVGGNVGIYDVKAMPNGATCGTRRDVVATSQGSATPSAFVCQMAGGGWAEQPQA